MSGSERYAHSVIP